MTAAGSTRRMAFGVNSSRFAHPPAGNPVWLPRPLVDHLEAGRRGTTLNGLCAMLLQVIVADDMFDAVLDDLAVEPERG